MFFTLKFKFSGINRRLSINRQLIDQVNQVSILELVDNLQPQLRLK